MKNLPPYKYIYETIRQQIIDEIFVEGDLLPSEHALSTTYDVARPTIRKALQRLQNEGYISKHQGRGSTVRGVPKGVGILSLRGTTTAVGEDNLSTIITHKPEIRSWDEAFTFSLSKTEKEVGCVYFERLRMVNGKPVFYDITMLPNINLPRFTQRNLNDKSLFDILRKFYQIEVIGGEQKILAIQADVKLQKHFNIGPNHPIVQLNRKIETNRYGFFIYSQVFCNSAEYALYGTF